MKARWKQTILAESESTIEVEGNHYFPPQSVQWAYFQASDTHTDCPWKGRASYHHIVIDGAINNDAAWYYPNPKAAAAQIKDYIAFWKGVEVVE